MPCITWISATLCVASAIARWKFASTSASRPGSCFSEWPASVSNASLIFARSPGVARSAAYAVEIVSRPWRSSSTSWLASGFCSSRSASGLDTTGAVMSETTKPPRPTEPMKPSASSRTSASRSDGRDTFSCAASSRSVGSFWPGSSLPAEMSDLI